MIRRRLLAGALAAALISTPIAGALAWEAQSTHAGLAEQAALASRLHARLRALGFERGLYEPLTVPPKDAPDLIAALGRLDPSSGFVPDARGRQFAIGWITAGAAIADAPFAQHHFFDPSTGKGWNHDGGIGDSVLARLGRGRVPDKGTPAPDWVVAKDNPLGLAGFLDQYAKAVRARTPAERSRHMAAALVAAGSILHVLADVGSPSHARADAAAHLDPVGTGRDDLGSRFERIAALAWGRLGVPAPARVVTRTTLRDFFTSKDGGGLADITAGHWFSAYTLPHPTRITAEGGRSQVRPQLSRPAPVPPARLNLMAASGDDGATLDDAAGVCLARYRVTRGVLTWSLDDACLLEQATAILPEVASFQTGLLDFLFRGELAVTASGGDAQIAATGVLGAGELELLAEDAAGNRTAISKVAVPASAASAVIGRGAIPSGSRRVVALYRGVDPTGEPVVAVGAAELP